METSELRQHQEESDHRLNIIENWVLIAERKERVLQEEKIAGDRVSDEHSMMLPDCMENKDNVNMGNQMETATNEELIPTFIRVAVAGGSSSGCREQNIVYRIVERDGKSKTEVDGGGRRSVESGSSQYGKGNWKLIQRDPELSPFLFARSNIDLKDNWRNLSGGPGGHGSREKSRPSKPKPTSASPQSSVVVKQTALPKPLIDDSSRSFAPSPNRYNELIIEAVSALKEPNGSDNRAIVCYIEVHNRYKIRKDETFGTKTPTPKQKGKRPKQLQNQSTQDQVHVESIFVFDTNACVRVPKISASILKALKSIMSNFLWGGGNGKKKIQWVKWAEVCKPKNEGGLRVRNLNFMNIALLEKWSWRFANERNSWRAVVNNYFKQDPFGSNFRSLCSFQVGNGKLCEFGDFHPSGWIWDVQVRRNLNDWEMEQWCNLMSTISLVSLSTESSDGLIWKGSGDGMFTVSSCVKKCVTGSEENWKEEEFKELMVFYVLFVKRGKLDQIELFLLARVRLASWFLAKYKDISIPKDSLISDPSIGDSHSSYKFLKSSIFPWCPPPIGFIKLNVDAATSSDWKKSGLGGILRDHLGAILGTFQES
ncbi:hypothetical protein F3Y22_tig00111952pilonHSYRG00040 [Hibiscus syriacus]|uniref:Uncharacterized protein n=1 Tax=Hibiscus syriacus TaxID=106335 RepID=A0A6A2YAK1_HIBSY|nr:hypothetical protein F3Y22_tig00111952pilonHSYRG00040 [Hibiscus syriacus]